MPSKRAIAKFIRENDFIMERGKATINDLRLVTTRLESETRSGGLADPGARGSVKVDDHLAPIGGCSLWSRVHVALGQGPTSPGHRAAFERFYLAWWNLMSRYQLDHPAGGDKSTCHRGTAGFSLAV